MCRVRLESALLAAAGIAGDDKRSINSGAAISNTGGKDTSSRANALQKGVLCCVATKGVKLGAPKGLPFRAPNPLASGEYEAADQNCQHKRLVILAVN